MKHLFAVYHSDGYECCDFVGCFETEAEAKTCAAAVKANVQQYWERIWADPGGLSKPEAPSDIISVAPIVVGRYVLPHTIWQEEAK